MSIESTLRKAADLARSGDRQGAARLFRQVLAKAPGHPKARQGLQALSNGGPVSPAAPGMEPPAAQMARLKQAFDKGDLGFVLREGNRMLKLFPRSRGLINALGISAARAGRPREALGHFDRAIALDPGNIGAMVNKATALLTLGDMEGLEQTCRAILEIRDDVPDAHQKLGFALANTGRIKEAEDSFRAAVSLAPDNPRSRIGLGNTLALQGRADEALTVYRAAEERAPDNPDIKRNIGSMLVTLYRPDEARDVLIDAITRFPRNSMLRVTLAYALRELGQPAEAAAEAEIAVEIDPKNAEGWGHLGSARLEMGDTEGANAAFDAAIEADPGQMAALGLRWRAETLPLTHPHYARITEAIARASTSAEHRSAFEMVLFRAHDKAGDTDAAFAHLTRSNKVRSEAEPYDIEAERAVFEAMKEMFSSAFDGLDQDAIAASPLPHRPVFIVGMPRSGTTLVEQILASHSQVHGAGEIPPASMALAEFGWGKSRVGMPPDPAMLGRVRQVYGDFIGRLGATAPVVTDKTPLNFRWLGFMLSAMPEARVLFTRRDARATCWSNLSHSLSGKANNFGNDMLDCAEMHLMHLDLMEFWQGLFPDRIAIVPYETLTENQEEESRKLVAAAGLGWEDACLDFERTERGVRTMSSLQVRKKMYTGSSEAWRRYEGYLGPMIARLDGVA